MLLAVHQKNKKLCSTGDEILNSCENIRCRAGILNVLLRFSSFTLENTFVFIKIDVFTQFSLNNFGNLFF